jgi:hypothetical protein
MGNGIGLTIQNMSDTFLSFPNTSFLLHNILHVPYITKKLLSVHKFTLETNLLLSFILGSFCEGTWVEENSSSRHA